MTVIQRNITSRQMLDYQTREQLVGRNDLTPELRYAQVLAAQQVRNFWYTATLQPRSIRFPALAGQPLLARTPALSNPVIVTDLLSMYEMTLASSQAFLPLEVREYGGRERSQGLDFFGLSGLVPQRYILHHEKNRSTAVGGAAIGVQFDLQGRFVGHVPRLLAPFQQLEFEWTNQLNKTTQLQLQVGLRAVRCWPDALSAIADRQIRNYIANSRPETFFLEATLPIANFPAVGVTVQFKTPQMDRPLMVLGAASNVEGCQAELEDESDRYVFTLADMPIAPLSAIPVYKAPPLALWAPNIDFRNTNLYNMFPVPHLLKPGAQLVVRLTNGLTPDEAGTFQETILTRAEQPARIVFLCRTV